MRLKTLLLAACAAALPLFAPGEAKAGHNDNCRYITKTVRENGNVRSYATKICYGGWNVSYYRPQLVKHHRPHVKKRRPHFVRHDYYPPRGRHYGHERRGHDRDRHYQHQHGRHCGHGH